MNIKPTTNTRKATYPTLTALATMAAISACQPQPQRIVGKFPAPEHTAPVKSTPAVHSTKTHNAIKTEPQLLVGRRAHPHPKN